MKRSSKFYPLKWLVECKPSGQPFFEVIAGFNSDSVAVHYAQDCFKTNPDFVYLVMQRNSRGGYRLLREFNGRVKTANEDS